MTREKFYNPVVKNKYFETFQNKTTKETTQYTFQKAKATEELIGKDIYEMNLVLLQDLITAMSASTILSAYNYSIKFQHYIDWAINNGYTKTNINPFLVIEDRRKWVEPFVAKYKQSLFTRNEVLDMCGQLVNYPDRAVLLALFEGISGEGFSELLNLRNKDIKEESNKYYVTLSDNLENYRKIEISDLLASYLYKSDNAEVYYNKNGESESTRSSESKFVDSPYIFKKLARGKKDGVIDDYFVRRKFQKFKDLFGAPFLTPKEVTNSGMLHLVNKYYIEKGVFGKGDWEKIAIQHDKDYAYRKKLSASEKSFIDKYGYSLNSLL